ncbi:hypothetical protein T08_12091 [Trichinella sp. T8]|uniref:Uncharacterized protein n=1 Tax=Trichinella murrelli TaxID=144512 RepID=A0A0V0UF73_9BILA|nr:hypothetical protein T05_10996 [Trichinella murrelli]KRZ97732.1 hypothetical protein T08_12091 [Trichinella sp. T8]
MENSCRGCLLFVTAAAKGSIGILYLLHADHRIIYLNLKCTARVECVGGEEYFEYFSIPLGDDFIIFEHYDVSFWLLPLDGIWLLLSAYANSKRHSLAGF